MSRHQEPRDWFFYSQRENEEEHQQTRHEDDADARRKGE